MMQLLRSEWPVDAGIAPIPVMSPVLPSADSLLPYLRRIDAARTYTNFGPLVREFEAGVCNHLQLPAGALVSASSGTAALMAAIFAVAGRAKARRPYALIPSYTFVATAVAAELCGYRPYLSDINPTTWMLDPERLLAQPALDRIGIVIPVAPYGMGVPQADWQVFRARTGIPVVIDGAASFEAASSDPFRHLGDVPVAMSFHATKGFGCGEGGGVACTDMDIVTKTTRSLNFGFHHSRDSASPSTNGKLTEYHAAVGLAELDGWSSKRRSFRGVSAEYRRLFANAGMAGRVIVAPEVCSSYALFECMDDAEASRILHALELSQIGFRHWYGMGVHRHPHFAHLPRDGLGVTNRLAPRILGLPMAPDLELATLERIVDTVVDAVRLFG